MSDDRLNEDPMSDEQAVLYEVIDESIGVVTLNRPGQGELADAGDARRAERRR